MIISKSLFKEYLNMPQLAWFSKNDKATYKMINKIRYAGIDGAKVGQEVEDAVLEHLEKTLGKSITHVDTSNLGFKTWHANYDARTQDAMKTDADVIYQPGFLANNLYCKCDMLVKNDDGLYDLREVKAKNSIRKKSKLKPLLDDLIYDVSFQDHVLRAALGDKYSGKAYIIHLNKQYKKHGDIDTNELLVTENVSDELITGDWISSTVTHILTDIPITKADLDTKHPYTGQDHLSYFGTAAPKKSIRKIPLIRSKLGDLYAAGKRNISDLSDDDIENFRKKDGEEGRLMRYMKLWNTDETVIDKEEIQKQFKTSLRYPLYFYDYETISVPLPLFENTSPWQQVITQYSMHKIASPGAEIQHKEGLIQNNQQDNKALIAQLIEDFEGGDGTYIVWYKGFENSRNNETGAMYPEFEEVFQKVNAHTYDLMEIFKDFHYFDRRFQGSCSIKKVLPVLTDISYDGLSISNGAIAAEYLGQLAKGYDNPIQAETIRANLLQYCKQDTWAMVRIWEEVVKAID